MGDEQVAVAALYCRFVDTVEGLATALKRSPDAPVINRRDQNPVNLQPREQLLDFIHRGVGIAASHYYRLAIGLDWNDVLVTQVGA